MYIVLGGGLGTLYLPYILSQFAFVSKLRARRCDPATGSNVAFPGCPSLPRRRTAPTIANKVVILSDREMIRAIFQTLHFLGMKAYGCPFLTLQIRIMRPSNGTRKSAPKDVL